MKTRGNRVFLPLSITIALLVFGTLLDDANAATFTTLYQFTAGDDGFYPNAHLVQGSDGNFYGTTYGGNYFGSDNPICFKVTPSGVLTSFCQIGNVANCLTLGSDGNFYGTTPDGGANNAGRFFRITPDGVLTSLYQFSAGSGGYAPQGPLVEGTNGNYYGTAAEGGIVDYFHPFGSGTVFMITPSGAFTTLHQFAGDTEGREPDAGLIRGSDGNFYGTTTSEGTGGQGTIFRISPNGVFTNLYQFSGPDGSEPLEAGLCQGTDGNFYGTTSVGGAYDKGTIFKLTPDGILTTLHHFTGGADGDDPRGGVIQGTDGDFYGTTSSGGEHNAGTIFHITSDGTFTNLYQFNGAGDGSSSWDSMIQGVDGDFYGTAKTGGITSNSLGGYGWGTIFKISTATTDYSYTNFTFITNNGAITITGYTGSGGNVAIPDTINGYPVTSIGAYAFLGQTTLTGAAIPDSVTNIGNSAFGDCSGLTNIAVNVANPSYASVGGVLFNKALTTLIQNPAGLTGSYAIPNSVTSIGDGAFGGCSGLMSVTIPDSVISIDTRSFGFCSGLTNVTIPNSVISVGSLAFAYCSGLTSVRIGNSVTNMGGSAFSSCSSLNQVYFQGNAPSVNGGPGSADTTVFSGELGTVYYVPGTTGWGATFGGWLTAGWYQPQPQILGSSYGLGVQSNGFQFTISWATNISVVVEASSNLQDWTAIITNTLVNGTNMFWDSDWTNYPQRFYRVRSP